MIISLSILYNQDVDACSIRHSRRFKQSKTATIYLHYYRVYIIRIIKKQHFTPQKIAMTMQYRLQIGDAFKESDGGK